MAEPAKPTELARDFYLPDFCASRATLPIVLIVELLALLLSFSHEQRRLGFWLDLGSNSLFLLWIGLASAGVFCLLRRRLAHLPRRAATPIALAIPVALTAVVCEVALRIERFASSNAAVLGWLPQERNTFVLRACAIAFIVTALALRYFYVAHEWRRNVQMEARSRIDALQARIRPHFLFNSMNTIAALARSSPAHAESAVLDLADLFRASLKEERALISLGEEIEIARTYERIEALRLGSRLRVEWRIEELPLQARVPGLSIQPMLENAIYHGIEQLPQGGTVHIEGRVNAGLIELTVRNPLPPASGPRAPGHRMAIDNVRQRLQLVFGERASLEARAIADHFEATLRFPPMDEQS